MRLLRIRSLLRWLVPTDGRETVRVLRRGEEVCQVLCSVDHHKAVLTMAELL